MRVGLVKAVEEQLKVKLSGFTKIALVELSGSKLEMLDGLRLKSCGYANMKNDDNLKQLIFLNRDNKEFLATFLSNSEYAFNFEFYEIDEKNPICSINRYNEGNLAHNKFLISFDNGGHSMKFVAGDNVVMVDTRLVPESMDKDCCVRVFTNTANYEDYSNGLIPDDEFEFIHRADGVVAIIGGSVDYIFKLPSVMGEENVIYDMWRIGKIVNDDYVKSYENGYSRQLVRTQ